MAREFWAADCETDPFLHGRMPEPFIFGAFNGEDYHEFATASEFVEFFYDKPVIVYAHNGGKFDWHFILDDLEPGTKIQVIGGRLAKFKIGAAEFRDSYSLLPIPLAAWEKDTFDYSLLEKDRRGKYKDAIRRYLKSDCENLYEILSRFFADYGRKLTLAGAAMSKWREISDETEDNSTPQFYESLKPYYYGGRVECFQKGVKNERFRVVDINSAYPRAMRDYHPWGTVYFTDNRLPRSDAEISRAFITIETASVGAFPFRDDSGLGFPSDHRQRIFHITGWEYLVARGLGLLGATSKISKVITFGDKISFADYVEHFYTLKADAKRRLSDPRNKDAKADYLFAKLFMNSLYGKFASDPSTYSEYMTCLPDEVEAFGTEEMGGYKIVTQLHNVAIVSRPLPEPAQRFYNVAVGASVTGYVRAMLLKAITASKGVLYCDTDSIAAAKPNVDIGDELGQWSDEGEFKAWAIAGKKLYAFTKKGGSYKIASKGAKLTAEQIIEIAGGAEIEYKQDAPTFGLRGRKFTTRKIRKT